MSKSISESSTNELLERIEKHKFCIRLIDAELSKRNDNSVSIKKGIKIKTNTSSNDAINKVLPKKASSPKKASPKKASSPKKGSSSKKGIATRDDMKVILKRKGIEFKESANKMELQELVRKNNLVRVVDNYHKERCAT